MIRRALLLATTTTFALACGGGDAAEDEGMDMEATAEAAMDDHADGDNPRFGVWRIQSDAPPPAQNIMTYEPYGDGGMRITVAATNGEGEETVWGYVTMFDGEFRPVEGREGNETAVEIVDERTNRITTRRDGRVAQVIINVLSEDGNRIDNEYRSYDADGNERISHAVYDRIR